MIQDLDVSDARHLVRKGQVVHDHDGIDRQVGGNLRRIVQGGNVEDLGDLDPSVAGVALAPSGHFRRRRWRSSRP